MPQMKNESREASQGTSSVPEAGSAEVKKKKIVKKIVKKKKKDGTVVSSTVTTLPFPPSTSDKVSAPTGPSSSSSSAVTAATSKEDEDQAALDFYYNVSIANPVISNTHLIESALRKRDADATIQINPETSMDAPDAREEWDPTHVLDANRDIYPNLIKPNEWISQTLDAHDVQTKESIRRYHERRSDVEHQYNAEDIVQGAQDYGETLQKPSLPKRFWSHVIGEFGNEGESRAELTKRIAESMNDPNVDTNSIDFVHAQAAANLADFKQFKKTNPGGFFGQNSRDLWAEELTKKSQQRRQARKDAKLEKMQNQGLGASNQSTDAKDSKKFENETKDGMEGMEGMDATQRMKQKQERRQARERRDPREGRESREEREARRMRGKEEAARKLKEAQRSKHAYGEYSNFYDDEWSKAGGTAGAAGAGDDFESKLGEDADAGQRKRRPGMGGKRADYQGFSSTNDEFEFELPHQTLHSGISVGDKETDLPLNTYWHKATVAPDNWNIMKDKFRDNMKPGSVTWNETAFRNDLERKQLAYWPQSLQTWFLRSEEELLNAHEFRCKMMDHSALEEYWRLGELRWNRKLWVPYIRVFQWTVAPIMVFTFWWRFRKMEGSPAKRTDEDWQKEYEKWKYMMKTGDADEYYMLHFTHSKLRDPAPIKVRPAPTAEHLETIQKRSMDAQMEAIMKAKYTGPDDPY